MKKLLPVLLISVAAACSCHSKKSSSTVMNGTLPVSYSSSGDSDTTLLFIHGWSINKEFWEHQVAVFSKRYHVVSMDLGGHGSSGKNRNTWTVPDYAGDVIAVIKALDLKKVILIGHSMSGDVMLEATREFPQPVIGMIGIDNLTDIGPEPLTTEQQQSVADWFHALETNFDSTATDYCKTGLFPPHYADTVSINRVITSVLNMDPAISIATLKALLDFAPREAALLSASKLPLHLIISSGTTLNEESLKKYCKAGYAVKKIQGTGHYPMIEKPAEFNTALQETIDHL